MGVILSTLPKTKIAPKNRPPYPKGTYHIPTIHVQVLIRQFQGGYVSNCRGCSKPLENMAKQMASKKWGVALTSIRSRDFSPTKSPPPDVFWPQVALRVFCFAATWRQHRLPLWKPRPGSRYGGVHEQPPWRRWLRRVRGGWFFGNCWEGYSFFEPPKKPRKIWCNIFCFVYLFVLVIGITKKLFFTEKSHQEHRIYCKTSAKQSKTSHCHHETTSVQALIPLSQNAIKTQSPKVQFFKKS